MSINNPTSHPVNGVILVAGGKSSRLQQMREKSQTPQTPSPVIEPTLPTNHHPTQLPPALRLAREKIDHRLAQILNHLPAGKQQSLFRIRYGVDLEQLKQLPIKRILTLLQIQSDKLNDIKHIGDLDYDGNPSR